jgi:ferredoxin
MVKRIKIDEEKCIGCGLCAELCGGHFEVKGDKAVVKKAEVEKAEADEAKKSCPVEAINIA